MRILVTGAAGFIGSWVCERLLQRGDEVLGLDNFDPFYDHATKDRNLSGPRAWERFRFTEGDILDGALVGRLLDEGVDGVRPFFRARAQATPFLTARGKSPSRAKAASMDGERMPERDWRRPSSLPALT